MLVDLGNWRSEEDLCRSRWWLGFRLNGNLPRIEWNPTSLPPPLPASSISGCDDALRDNTIGEEGKKEEEAMNEKNEQTRVCYVSYVLVEGRECDSDLILQRRVKKRQLALVLVSVLLAFHVWRIWLCFALPPCSHFVNLLMSCFVNCQLLLDNPLSLTHTLARSRSVCFSFCLYIWFWFWFF